MFKLKLNNYRGFLNQEFDFSRVNILIGENSAGKSSIFKFLMALKQSLRSPNNRDYNLTLFSNEVDLGNYAEVIYNHETERNLSFSFEFAKDYYDYFFKDGFTFLKTVKEEKEILKLKNQAKQYLPNVKNSAVVLSFEVCENLSNHNNIIFSASNEYIGSIQIIFLEKTFAQAFFSGNNTICEIIFENKQYNQTFNLKNVEYAKQGFLTMINPISLIQSITKYTNLTEIETDSLFWQIAYILSAQNYLTAQLNKIEYTNPLAHRNPARIYYLRDKRKVTHIKDIEDLVEFLDAVSPLEEKAFKTNLMKLLKTFGIVDDFYLKKEGASAEFRVVINELENNIKDVGFGVSLQMPILAQAILSDYSGEILLIEQPEVHLHPRLQAKFMEALLSIGTNNVYFIETHSEHIIRMLQVMVKTKKIASGDISIHYFKKEGTEMQKSEHKIEFDGVLMPNFPKGFYDVSYNLALNLMD